MAEPFLKSVSYRLGQASKFHRARAASLLADIGLHPGQETILKALSEQDGQTMGELAKVLGVKPPTVTKMVARLGNSGFVSRQSEGSDGRSARVFLTPEGETRVKDIDNVWRTLEKDSLAGFDDKDRKRLRKLLRKMEKNLRPDRTEKHDQEIESAVFDEDDGA